MPKQFWHRWFGVSYRLTKRYDSGSGQPIVLLHGIGRSAAVWQPLLKRLLPEPYRVVAFDLLGFGESPKPDWIDYSIDDHAAAVIAIIRRQRFKQPVIIIGHSLGALVALRVARLRPDLVKHVILYEMPLYEGLPDKRRYKARLAAYFAFYDWVIKQQPSFGDAKKRLKERIAGTVVGSELTEQTWQPFIKTLQNSIMRQTGADDIQHLQMNADIIYGSRDMFVIRGKVSAIFGSDALHVTAHTIKARHRITTESAAFIFERVQAVDKDLQPLR